MQSALKAAIEQTIIEATGEHFEIYQSTPTSGGCIHEAHLVSDQDRHSYFVKTNQAQSLAMFQTEAVALQAIASTQTIGAPKPIGCGQVERQAYIVMEAIEFAQPKPEDWVVMGEQLAAMHKQTSDRYGWPENNWIGSSPQINTYSKSWADFFGQYRLRPQFELAQRNGYEFPTAEKLIECSNHLLADHKPPPSLLHGDLWSGNAGFSSNGQPVIYDPASYYGDRETDIAFTEFFGGFPAAFYQSYHKSARLTDAYQTRKKLYNLYHILNHVNLFGGSYVSAAKHTIAELLAQ